MKNLLISLLFVALATTSLRAQTPNEIITSTEKPNAAIPMSAGSRFVGLNGTGAFGGGSGTSTNMWSVTGQGGYFVASRLLVGLQFSYGEYNRDINNISSYRFTPTPPVKQNDQFYMPELFSRYYFTSGKVKPFVQLSAGWNFQRGDRIFDSGEDSKIARNQFSAGAALGLSFKVAKRVNIDLMYSSRINKPTHFIGPDGLKLGLTFTIGK